MSLSFNYNIVQIVPDPLRGEVMNVGIALHTTAGPQLRLRLIPSRLKALSPSLGRIAPEEWLDSWQAALARLESPELKWSWLTSAMAPLSVNSKVGVIHCEHEEGLEAQVQAILERMVLPQKPSRNAPRTRVKRSGLHSQITSWLRSQQVFSRNMQDLINHRVVGNYPLNVDEEMFAEFALKNGSIHVLETLDLRGHAHYTKGLRNEASHKALVLDLAQDTLEGQSQRIALVAADDYSEMKPAMSLLNRKATSVLSMDSSHDRQWLADFVAQALHLESLLPPVAQPLQVSIAPAIEAASYTEVQEGLSAALLTAKAPPRLPQ